MTQIVATQAIPRCPEAVVVVFRVHVRPPSCDIRTPISATATHVVGDEHDTAFVAGSSAMSRGRVAVDHVAPESTVVNGPASPTATQWSAVGQASLEKVYKNSSCSTVPNAHLDVPMPVITAAPWA